MYLVGLIITVTDFVRYPKGPVELGNKAVSKFYFIPAQEAVLL